MQFDGLVGTAPGDRQGQPHFVLTGRYGGAAEGVAGGRVLELQRDLIVETVVSQRMDDDRYGRARASADAGGRHAQIVIRPGMADAQAIGVKRSTLLLGVAQVE